MNTEPTRVEASPGPVDIDLGEAGTGGYRWFAATLPDGVASLGDDFDHAADGSGRRRFHLRIDAAGTYGVDFQLRRPWETRPIDERRFEVVVTAG